MARILIWGRHGGFGPDYPRNRTMQALMRELGHELTQFQPSLSRFGDLQYRLARKPRPDLVWVSCFRQRDLLAAARYARRAHVPLVFDPLISAFDKQTSERTKFSADSWRGRRLLAWERRVFAAPDWVIADTAGHAAYFHQTLGVPRARLRVIAVGAEEALFSPLPPVAPAAVREVVFFGSFIGLQGLPVITQAIAACHDLPLRFRLLGDGPERKAAEAALATQVAAGQVVFEPWCPLQELPARLASADVFLGIFGASPKALRVIPNKVYQALALGRPVITARSSAYPEPLLARDDAGLCWVAPGDPDGLHAALRAVADPGWDGALAACRAAETYRHWFALPRLRAELADLLRACLAPQSAKPWEGDRV